MKIIAVPLFELYDNAVRFVSSHPSQICCRALTSDFTDMVLNWQLSRIYSRSILLFFLRSRRLAVDYSPFHIVNTLSEILHFLLCFVKYTFGLLLRIFQWVIRSFLCVDARIAFFVYGQLVFVYKTMRANASDESMY
jgi:hypothetical protein